MDNKDSNKRVKSIPVYQGSQSYQRHKKQLFWQILLPVGAGVLLMLAIAVMVIMAVGATEAGGPVSQWADTSMIWLSTPVMVFALLISIVLIFFTYLIAQLLKILPQYTSLAQQYTELISAQIKHWSNKVLLPYFAVSSFQARIKAFFPAVFGHNKR